MFEQDVKKICTLEKGDRKDFGVSVIYQNLLEYAKKDDNLSTENS